MHGTMLLAFLVYFTQLSDPNTTMLLESGEKILGLWYDSKFYLYILPSFSSFIVLFRLECDICFETQVAKSPDGNGGVYTGMLMFLKLSVYTKQWLLS